jgi:hypothetical protein
MKEGLDESQKLGEESLEWLENFLKRLSTRPWTEEFLATLPKIIRAQDVLRAVNDLSWLDERNIQRRAKHRKKVARLRAEARAKDLDGFRRRERESRARRRRGERDRDGGRAAAVRAASRMEILKAWPTGSEAVSRAISGLGTSRRRSRE